MKTNIEEFDDKIVATLEGELDTTAALQMEQTLQPLLNNKGRDILIDCTRLEYIASSGLRILMAILKRTKAEGKTVTLRNVNEDIKDVFRVTGFLPLFNFES